MSVTKAKKPNAGHARASDTDRFGRLISLDATPKALEIQTVRIEQRFGLPYATARSIAALAYGVPS